MVVKRFKTLPSRKTYTQVSQTPCSCAQEQNGFTIFPSTYRIFQQMSTFAWMCQYSSSTLFTQDKAKLSNVLSQFLYSYSWEQVENFLLSQKFPTSNSQCQCSEQFTGHSLQSAPCRAPATLLVSWESRDMQLLDQQSTLWRWSGLWLGMQSLVFQMS